jgi:hypothetical protein
MFISLAGILSACNVASTPRLSQELHLRPAAAKQQQQHSLVMARLSLQLRESQQHL